jgi:hypothetical protein
VVFKLVVRKLARWALWATVLAGGACATSSSDPIIQVPAPNDGGALLGDAGAPPPPTAQGDVYGHTDTALYKVDTQSHLVSQIGVFEGCTYVADIALDKDSNIYASTSAALYLVQTNTAECTKIASGTFPNSLSFVPVGTLDPSSETLVGFQGGDYVKIDTMTGAVTKVGSLGGGFESSGDIVSAIGGKTYVSVKGPGCADCLVEIDPTSGTMTKNWGSIGYVDVFGLAFWAGQVYGFTAAGQVLLIAWSGDALAVTELPIQNPPAGLAFKGAGSTTAAPIGPVH